MEELIVRLYKTFILQDRYLLFLEGIRNTLVLTLISFLLGTILGGFLCIMLQSKHKAVRKTASIIQSVFIELPTLVMMMIFVYIVFGETALPVFWIVLIVLLIKAGVYISAIFETALSAVNKGEIEAARALGMNSSQAFMNVILPQVIHAALPVYKSQFVATMQETSVVGYLAIVDITRASTIISSRMMDSIISLSVITVLYFIIGKAGKELLNLLDKISRKGLAKK